MANLYDTPYFNADVKSLSSFFETPQFTQDYTKAGNIGGEYYGLTGGTGPYEKQGLSSDVRHTLASSVGKNAFIDYISQFGFEPTGKIANLYGNIGITGATAIQEIPDAWKIGKEAFEKGDYGAITSGKFLSQPWEDVKANLNAWNIPYDSTEEEKLSYIPTLQDYMRRDKQATQQGTIAFDPNKINEAGMSDMYPFANIPSYLLTKMLPKGLKYLQQKFKNRQGTQKAHEELRNQIINQRAAANQVRQNIQTYGSGDRPNTGMNRPGGGKGQSPTGGDVAGTPFSRGGILGAF